jgi:hypothetical protein
MDVPQGTLEVLNVEAKPGYCVRRVDRMRDRVREFWNRLRGWISHREETAADLAEEIQSHLDMQAQDYIERRPSANFVAPGGQ